MRLAAWVFALLAVPAQAAPWEFSAPLDITPEQPGVFHQLDSAGRKHIAVSGDTVAVVWEQSRGGASQVTVAFKPLSVNVFSLQRVSSGATASMPVIAALGSGRFLLAWEQDGDLHARVAEAAVLGPRCVWRKRLCSPVWRCSIKKSSLSGVRRRSDIHEFALRISCLMASA